MKYARLIYGTNKYNKNNQFANLGDCFQSIAVENLYRHLGIPQDDIIYVKREHLDEYKDNIILPMQGYFSCIKGLTDIYPIPDNYRPVYIGYHDIFTDFTNSRDKYNYLKRFAPIGCRDEKTYQMIRKKGIPAYISGCLTITFPTRDLNIKREKVFLVDAPNHIEDYMPEQLKKSIEYATHEIEYNKNKTYEENSRAIEAKASALLERYRDEAKLIITSRLHVAAPCLGMGIPVILARKYYDDRYGWIGRYLPLYTQEQFGEIDWDAQVYDLSLEKALLTDIFDRLLRGAAIIEPANQLNELFLSRNQENLNTPLVPRCYKKLQALSPEMADFTREKILHPFSVATARKKNE